MKRTLSSSVLKKRENTEATKPSDQGVTQTEDHVDQNDETSGVRLRLGGAGGAWKAGALSDAEKLLQNERDQVVVRILAGQQELSLSPSQIVDAIGSDRREDWRDQEAYEGLRESIKQNGQDTPVQVWPSDPDWRPDPRDPKDVSGVEFELIVGRRRHAILQELGSPVRAILVPQDKRGSRDEHFEMLFMRFRENEERENLSAFERLVSIGEMYERLLAASPDGKLTATAFSERVGVHNSSVSRGRAVYAAKDQILHACKNVYELSHRDLEKIISDLSGKAKAKPAKAASERKTLVERKIGKRKLLVTGRGSKLTISANGLTLNKRMLEGLGDVIAQYINEHEPK